MKITKSQLKQIIKEELESVMTAEREKELNALIDARMKLVGFGVKTDADLDGDFEAAKQELVDDELAKQEEMDAIQRYY
tara:strand:- start:934 stop:1170 length:237 start_codon:yes stop_codon:yes gene_type:complete